ncbi:MAG TPA: redoxin domain-containing protein, partial [Bacillales bacterium]|nr:redoxin domain-containing protein [Bacillales bacterium]
MRIFVPICLFAALVVLGAFGYAGKNAAHIESSGSQPNERVGVHEGDLAPNITLENLHGKTVNLSDYRGKTVLINFWATWCPHCKEEMAAIEQYYQDHHSKGFIVLSVNDLSAEKNRKVVASFVRSNHLTFLVVLDRNEKVSRIYRVGGLPTSYFIGPKGKVRAENVGPLT